MKQLIVFIFIATINVSIYSQKDDKKHKPVQISGSASVFGAYYNNSDTNTVISPYSYGINISPTLRIKSLNLPFHFVYADNKSNISSPFIRLGIAPSYKWMKFYLGNNTVNFSRYAFSGLNVFGAGFELNPKFFHLGFIAGKVTPRIFVDSTSIDYSRVKQRYATNGYAVRTGIKSKSFRLLITYFKGSDDEASLPYINTNQKLHPRYNKALGGETMIRFGKYVTLTSNGGLSIFTRNKYGANLDTLIRASKGEPIPDWAKVIEKNPNSSTQLLFAYDNVLQFTLKNFTLALKQKEVKPDFKSLGLRFINNDLRQYTVEPSFRLKNNKVIGNFSIGIQQNNLNNKLKLNNRSNIFSANVTLNPNQKIWLSANYSNFGTVVRSSNVFTEDSISIKNINSNTSINGTYYLENSGSNSKSIGAIFNAQKTKEAYEFNRFNNTDFNSLFTSIYFNRSIAKVISYSAGFNFNRNTTAFVQMPDRLFNIESYGIYGNVSKPFFEKEKLNISINAFVNLAGTINTGKTLAHGATLSSLYKLSEKWTWSIGYNYSKSKIEANNFFQQNINSNITVNF